MDSCCDCNQQSIVDTVKPKPPLYIPRKNCRVHFSGGIMGGTYVQGISAIYQTDEMSEYVGEGDYPDNSSAFPKAVQTTFDGIAIDSGTRLIIYSERNFQGRVLIDVVGPRIINNIRWSGDIRYKHVMTDKYPPLLEINYPRPVREWSKEDMHPWSLGSCKIICSEGNAK